ncbi:MAG: DUF5666 domain-containing protein [Pseudomonadota bacterium]
MSRVAVDRRRVVLGLGAGALSACAGPASQVADVQKEDPRGGIGGTGIVGVLTEFGSLIVNGLKIEIDDRTRVDTVLGRGDLDDLALGQALTVEADTEAGGLFARRVLIADPLVGRLEAVSGDGRRLRVNGVEARLDPGVASAAKPGDRVAVSGLWRGAAVAASRVALAATGPDAISGAVTRRGDAVLVGGRALTLAEEIAPPPIGSFAVVRGTAESEGIAVETLSVGRFVGATAPLARLSVEGYLDRIPTAPFYAVSGLGHSFDTAARLASFAGARTIFSGAYTGAFAVETGLILPEGAGARRRLLTAGVPAAQTRPAR